jgi:hypothetical protein
VTSTPPGRNRAPDALRYTGLGIQLAVTVGVLAWAGEWLDRRLGTGGIVTVVLVLGGFVVVIMGLVRELKSRRGPDQ